MSETFNAVQNILTIAVCKDAAEATRQGYFYRPPVYLPIRISKVVVVEKGTKSGNATVDLILEDEKGQKFVCMLTGALLRSIPL
jgi:hypothetical protein